MAESEYDVFISHASEDKEALVAPLASALRQLGVRVWYDEFTLRAGDSISRSIDCGLASSRYGLVVLSPAFISKPWPEYELRGLVSRELERKNVIIPVWFNVTKRQISDFSPPLADKLAIEATGRSAEVTAVKVCEIVRPDLFRVLIRRLQLERLRQAAPVREERIENIRLGELRHLELPEETRVRIRLVYLVFREVLGSDLDQWIDSFQRDLEPREELAIWEKLAVAFLEFTGDRNLHREIKREVVDVLLATSMGMMSGERAGSYPLLGSVGIQEVMRTYLHCVPEMPQRRSRE